MTAILHLMKLCVGAESPDDLAAWQKRFGAGPAMHVTRMWPKREAELLAGGSIYWVFKGVMLARQRILSLERIEGGGHHSAHDGEILSPMPGKVIAVDIVAGQAVTKGQKLLTLEAMKMEHSLTAPFDGVVAELLVTAGAQVQVEAVLVRVEAAAA